MAKSKS